MKRIVGSSTTVPSAHSTSTFSYVWTRTSFSCGFIFQPCRMSHNRWFMSYCSFCLNRLCCFLPSLVWSSAKISEYVPVFLACPPSSSFIVVRCTKLETMDLGKLLSLQQLWLCTWKRRYFLLNVERGVEVGRKAWMKQREGFYSIRLDYVLDTLLQAKIRFLFKCAAQCGLFWGKKNTPTRHYICWMKHQNTSLSLKLSSLKRILWRHGRLDSSGFEEHLDSS